MAALILFLLADYISLTMLKVRSILADEAFTPITSLAMGASAGNLCSEHYTTQLFGNSRVVNDTFK